MYIELPKIENYVVHLQNKLYGRSGCLKYKLSSIRDTVNTHLGKTECGNFRNRDIQLLL